MGYWLNTDKLALWQYIIEIQNRFLFANYKQRQALIKNTIFRLKNTSRSQHENIPGLQFIFIENLPFLIEILFKIELNVRK